MYTKNILLYKPKKERTLYSKIHKYTNEKRKKENELNIKNYIK